MPVETVEQRVLAVDIGGTKIAVGVVDGEGRVLENLRGATQQSSVSDGGERSASQLRAPSRPDV